MLNPSSFESRFARYQCSTLIMWVGEAENAVEEVVLEAGGGDPAVRRLSRYGWKGAEKGDCN